MPDVTSCPHCGVVPEALGLAAWGDGVQRLEYAPYLCQACGGLSLVWLETGRLMRLSSEHEAILREHNPALWEAITAARAAMRAP